MGFVDVDDVVRVTAHMKIDGTDDVLNVFHVQNEGPANLGWLPFMDGVDEVLHDAYDYMVSQQTTALTYEFTHYWNVTKDEEVGFGDFGDVDAGTNITDALPSQVAGLVTFGVEGSGNKGKKFLGGLTVDSNEAGGILSAGAIDALAYFASTILAGIEIAGSTITFGNYNYTFSSYVMWVAALVDLIWSTQRRRKLGVGS